MNREICFRGKRIDNGEWVYGDFFHSWEKMNTKPDIQIYNNMGYFDVDPATVGQFTGLVDKNKKRIFDGDVVRMEFFDTEEIGEIVWDEERCKFAYDSPDGDRYGVDGTTEIEVLGNIHDHPALLQG